MKKAALLLLMLAASPLRAETDRFFAVASDFMQSLHKAHCASQVNVDPHRPLVSLVLALDEQVRVLNEARLVLLKHREEPVSEARRAIEGLLNGINLLTLVSTQDMADINAVADRWETAQRMEGRRDDRREAVDVMAAAVVLFRESLTEEVEKKVGRKKTRVKRPRFTPEGLASLVNQVDLLFADEFQSVKDGGEAGPIVGAALTFRQACRELPPPADAPQKSP